MATEKVPVYISFDYDHDSDLKQLLVNQANKDDSPFSIADWSIKEASSDWKDKARKRIKRVNQIIVLCGEHTDTATGINAEIAIARDEKKPYFLLAGRASGNNKKPTAALSTDKLYKWDWPNLKALIGGSR
jgi:Thoeris protein ThsB, TIR-like domain